MLDIRTHRLILRALARGIAPSKIATSLNVSVTNVRRRVGMLNRLSADVRKMLKDRIVDALALDQLRKMKPARQREAAEMMLWSVNFSSSYAKVLLAATKRADLAKPDMPKRVGRLSVAQMARMESEMASAQRAFKAVESCYAKSALNLVVAAAYVSKLVGNPHVKKYLSQRHPRILKGIKSVTAEVN